MQIQNKSHQRLSDLLCPAEELAFKVQHLTPENTEQILGLKNKYAGKRCFIVGSSPSLDYLNLAKLNHEYTFTVNREYMLKENGLKHSNFHVMMDANVFEDTDSKWEEINTFTDCLFCYAGMDVPTTKLEPIYFDYKLWRIAKVPCQTDLEQPLVKYQSSVHFAIQIAAYLGFTKIYLVGIDLRFSALVGHVYPETFGETQRQRSHSLKEAETMLIGIDRCGKFLKSKGIEMYNASPKGIVDCIPRVKYEGLF